MSKGIIAYKYDMNLKQFVFEKSLKEYGYPDLAIYQGHDGECRLGHYLMSAETLKDTYVGYRFRLAVIPTTPELLVTEDLGEIIGVEPRLGYWIVTQNEKVDIFRGQNGIRPVVFES